MLEERKFAILNRFEINLEIRGFDDILTYLDEVEDDVYENLSADQVWAKRAEMLAELPRLPEDLLVFSSPTPNWEEAAKVV
jgi:hypothetical protein